ncbi:unnamed protein product [Calypogeia fissa]
MVSVKDCPEEIKRVARRRRHGSQLQAQQTNHEAVGSTIAIMLQELGNLAPDETAHLERNMLKKHLGRLIKVATFSSRVMKGLREEVKQKNEVIKTLQETVREALLQKEDLKKRATPSPAPKPPSTCQLCSNYNETKRQAQLLQDALQSLNTHIIDLMRNNSSRGTSARSSLFSTPRHGRGQLERTCFIWDRETVRKLDEHEKLTKDTEILKRKLDEAKHLLAASECQRGGALVTVDQLMSEVRRAKERIRILEFSRRSRSKSKRGGTRLSRIEAATSKKREGGKSNGDGQRIPLQQRTANGKVKQRDDTTVLEGNEIPQKADRKRGQIAWRPTCLT